MKQIEISEIVGKTIRWTRTEAKLVRTGSRLMRVETPVEHHDYRVTGIIDDAKVSMYVVLSILIDDDKDESTLIIEPSEVNMLLLGVPVRLLSGGNYSLIA